MVQTSRLKRRDPDVRVEEVSCRHPPRLADRLLAARHSHVAKPGHAPILAIIADQELAAPYGAVRPVAGAVEDDADHGFGQAVLGHAASHVSMMVLHGEQPRAE